MVPLTKTASPSWPRLVRAYVIGPRLASLERRDGERERARRRNRVAAEQGTAIGQRTSPPLPPAAGNRHQPSTRQRLLEHSQRRPGQPQYHQRRRQRPQTRRARPPSSLLWVRRSPDSSPNRVFRHASRNSPPHSTRAVARHRDQAARPHPTPPARPPPASPPPFRARQRNVQHLPDGWHPADGILRRSPPNAIAADHLPLQNTGKPLIPAIIPLCSNPNPPNLTKIAFIPGPNS